MKCFYCGEEMEDKLFCTNCGKEVQIMAEQVLEDEYISSLVGSDDDLEHPFSQQTDTKEAQKTMSSMDRTKMCLAIILGGLCFVILVILMIVNMNHKNSYTYQVEQGNKAASNGQYEKAISYYEKAIRIETEDLEVRKSIAQCYEDMGNLDGALVSYLEIVDLDPDNVQAYMKILAIYESRGDIDAILALCDKITDEEVLSIFYGYVVMPPKFNVSGGNYETYISLELSAPEGSTIYYTSDRTDPIKYGKTYESPIALDSMRDYTIMAVVKNDKGIYSSVVTNEYSIVIPRPDLPTVTPEDGIVNEENLITIQVQEGYEAHFTWDGSDPTYLSELYTGPMAAPQGSNILSIIVIDPITEQYSDIYQQVFVGE